MKAWDHEAMRSWRCWLAWRGSRLNCGHRDGLGRPRGHCNRAPDRSITRRPTACRPSLAPARGAPQTPGLFGHVLDSFVLGWHPFPENLGRATISDTAASLPIAPTRAATPARRPRKCAVRHRRQPRRPELAVMVRHRGFGRDVEPVAHGGLAAGYRATIRMVASDNQDG